MNSVVFVLAREWSVFFVTLLMSNIQGQAFITVNDIDSALAIFRVVAGWLAADSLCAREVSWMHH